MARGRRQRSRNSRRDSWLYAGLISINAAFSATLVIGDTGDGQSDVKVVPSPSDDNRAPRRWQVTTHETSRYKAPSVQAETVDTLAESAVLMNLGCEEVSGHVWCETRRLNGRATAFVLRDGLVPAMGPDGVVPRGEDNSKSRARSGDFDATGQVACAQERGEALALCSASVARSDGGDATVVVTFSNGFKRQLYFVHGQFVRASATMSGVGTDIEWRRDGSQHVLRVDDQQFEIPIAFLFGD